MKMTKKTRHKEGGHKMKRMIWSLKQLLPFVYVSEYSTNGHLEVAVWRQWFGKSLWVRKCVVQNKL